MNVAKNWALTIMLIALAFAHFSSELLLKEQMIIPVKKTLNNAGHIDAKLIDFSEICQKKPSEIGCFLLIVSWRSFPPKISREIGRVFLRNFDFFRYNPWNWPICLRILTFLPRNRPIFPRILIFLPQKSRKIGRFFHEFWLFSHENPTKSTDFPRICP